VPSCPDVDIALVFVESDENSQYDARIIAFHGRDLMDVAGIEEIKVSGPQIYLTMADVLLRGVVVEGMTPNVGLDLFCPQALVEDALRCRIARRILHTENPRKLVLKTTHGVVEALFSQGDVVDMGRVGVSVIVNTEDRRPIGPSVWFKGGLHLSPISGHLLQCFVDDVDGVRESLE